MRERDKEGIKHKHIPSLEDMVRMISLQIIISHITIMMLIVIDVEGAWCSDCMLHAVRMMQCMVIGDGDGDGVLCTTYA